MKEDLKLYIQDIPVVVSGKIPEGTVILATFELDSKLGVLKIKSAVSTINLKVSTPKD
jgi:hypothetical protein